MWEWIDDSVKTSYYIVADVVHNTGIIYHRRGYSFSRKEIADFLIFTVDFINTSNNLYHNVYFGFYSDLDVPDYPTSPPLTATDLVGYVDSLNLVYEKDQDSYSLNDSFNTHIGIKFLDNNQDLMGFHPWCFQGGCMPGDSYLYNNYLSQITIPDTPFIDTNDWALYLCASAPDFIPGGTLSYAFGIVAGHTKDSMIIAAVKMQQLYDSLLVGVEENPIIPSIKIINLQISPNPTTGLINCFFSSSKDIEVNYKIFDIQGRLIADIGKNQALQGNNEIILDLSEFDHGLYFVTASGDNFSFTEKIILFK